jgi:hypothetical protein
MSKEATLLSRLDDLSQKAQHAADDYSGVLGDIQRIIVENFGQNGLYAAYILAAVLVLVLVSRLTRISFNVFKFVVVPALALAFVVSLFTSMQFVALLPVTVTLCSLILLFKG